MLAPDEELYITSFNIKSCGKCEIIMMMMIMIIIMIIIIIIIIVIIIMIIIMIIMFTEEDFNRLDMTTNPS